MKKFASFAKQNAPGGDSAKHHYENMPIQIYWKVNHLKIENFQTKNSNIFHISAQNIDCGYSLTLETSGHNLCFWAEIYVFEQK